MPGPIVGEEGQGICLWGENSPMGPHFIHEV